MKTQTPRTNRAVADSNGQWSFELRYCSRQLETELATVTEQRDRLQLIVDEQCRVSSVCREYREQRDRLADLVKQFIYILDITEESDGGRLFHPTNITSCRAGDLQKAGELVEALRRASRNQPTEP